jgi:succinate dehydrogenase/fumarate reductase flavoprotein subunit
MSSTSKQQYPELMKLKDITRLENTLMTDLNDFNNKYACYLRNPTTNSTSVNAGKIINPCTQNVSKAEVDAAKTKVDQDITNLHNAINVYKYTGGTNQAQYNTKFNKILEDYNKVIELRTDLDKKLAELYDTETGINNFYSNKYSATMFTKLMLTILLTSLAYYTFMKIIEK